MYASIKQLSFKLIFVCFFVFVLTIEQKKSLGHLRRPRHRLRLLRPVLLRILV